jgi:hypothetical protein
LHPLTLAPSSYLNKSVKIASNLLRIILSHNLSNGLNNLSIFY